MTPRIAAILHAELDAILERDDVPDDDHVVVLQLKVLHQPVTVKHIMVLYPSGDIRREVHKRLKRIEP